MITITEGRTIIDFEGGLSYLYGIILLPRRVQHNASLGVPVCDRASIVLLIPGRNVALQELSALQNQRCRRSPLLDSL